MEGLTDDTPRGGRWFWLALAAIMATAAWLRFRLLGGPSLWLDELLNYGIVTAAAKEPWHAWLLGFEVENGPLYYALQRAGRIATDVELSSRIAPAAVGTATVALIGVLGHRISATVGLAAAALMAFSPLHVYYSREGRAYALLMFFATLILLALTGERRSSIGVAIGALAGAAFTAATAAPLIVSAAGTALLRLPFSRRRRIEIGVLAGSVAAAGILALHYLKYPRPAPALGMPPVDLALIVRLVNGLTVTSAEAAAANPLAVAIAAVAVIGAAAAFHRDRALGIALAAMTLLPLVTTIVSLSMMRHWFSIRYVSPALPAFLVLVAAGLESIGRVLQTPRLSTVAVLAASLGVAAVNAPNALQEPLRKVDWRGAAEYVASHARPGQSVVSSNDWSMICVSFYLRQIGSPVRVASAAESIETMKRLIAGKRAWIVEGGWYANTAIVDWLAPFCPVWMSPTPSPFESLRIRFAPDCAAFLASGVTRVDLALLERWFVDERGSRLEMTEHDARFLAGGWSGPEDDPTGPTFRWVDGRRATAIVFAPGAGARLRFRARPFVHPTLSPQRVTVAVNAHEALAATLSDGWSEHEIAPNALRQGLNEVVFEFARATRPADLDPNAADRRELSAAFDFIEVVDGRRE